MKIENHELNLLSNVSKTLIECAIASEMVQMLERIFNRFGRTSNRFVELKKLNIFIYDENSKTLRDYSKSWIEIEKGKNEYNDHLYLVITQLSHFDFFVNGTPHRLEDITDFSTVKSNDTNNIMLLPLKKGNKPFGIIELIFPNTIENMLDPDFFMMIAIASYLISVKIQNSILTEQMQRNIDFHKAMKDIAKTIETQYELNYVIPIIGEMIDRFVSNHLIYVFLKDDENTPLRLVWPNTCRDTSVLEVISKIKEDSKFILVNEGKIGIFPLIGKKLLGCIVAHSNTDKLVDKEIDYLEQLSKQSSITIQRANAYAEILQHATLDALTGLNNRRQFEVRLKQEVSTAERQGKPLCAIMLDIDHFKKVNDTYGHIAGDIILKNTAAVIKGALREYDIPSRYGGEEFIILLPYTKLDEAVAVAERLRQSVEKSTADVPSDNEESTLTLGVTISLGVYEYHPGDSPQQLYENADKALYQAKTTGRNRVFINEGQLV